MSERKITSIAGSQELVRREIDALEQDLARYASGRIPDGVFTEQRLRFGIYGQRQDGVHMLRSKLPLGLADAEQLEAFADVAERFGSGVAHLTTRQDIQVHFVQLEQTPDLLRTLDRVDATSREACGNVVRNVTASPVAGVDPSEPFDVTPHGLALAQYLLRHPDAQSLGRKFKIHLSGSDDSAYQRSAIHDIGLTARRRAGVDGFEVRVGGGLGAVAYEAWLYDEFLPADQLQPFVHAVLRVFSVHGEKKKRARARLKFLVDRWGLDRFRLEVERVRELEAAHWKGGVGLPRDVEPTPLPPGRGFPIADSPEYSTWLRTNVELQKQAGYASVRVRVPRGDLSPVQLRGLADVVRRFGTLRISPEQDLLLRWVPTDRLGDLREALHELELAAPRAGALGDTVTCPGADTCKLGITSPRLLERSIAGPLEQLARHPELEGLTVRISGCPNSCAQHQIADIGLFGAARTVAGVSVPHYQLLLGGRPTSREGEDQGALFGRVVTKLPAARVGEALLRIGRYYREEREGDEDFGDFVRRVGRSAFQERLRDLQELPSLEEAPDLYREPGRDSDFQMVRGVGECAGAMVDAADLLLVEADGLADGAEGAFEDKRSDEARENARAAMMRAARALLATEHVHPTDPVQVADAFRVRFYETGRIFEGVGHTFFSAQDSSNDQLVGDRLRRLVVEARLFVEEAHSIVSRARGQAAAPVAAPSRP